MNKLFLWWYNKAIPKKEFNQMSLIGILTQKSYENYLKQSLKKWIPEEQIFFLKEDSIQNLRNIKFETILIGKKVEKNEEQINNLTKKAEYLIFNTDIIENLKLLDNLKVKLITYGFGSKATVTASSVEDGKMMVCLQRTLQNIANKSIEPQELQITLKQDDTMLESSSYLAMEAVSLKLLYGI